MKLSLKITLFLLLFLPSHLLAASYAVSGKIGKIEFYGSNMTVYLSGATIPASACTHNDRFAVEPNSADPNEYKAFYGLFLAAYLAQKTIDLRVTDSPCVGDRPGIWYAATLD